MSDAGEGPGPCIRVCTLGGDGRCLGCRRTPRDFAAWPGGLGGGVFTPPPAGSSAQGS